MNCNCVNRMEKRVAKFAEAQAGAGATATCLAVSYLLEPSFHATLNIPFQIKGTAKGFTSTKGKTMPVMVSYCPFCGVSAKRPRTIGRDEGLDAAFGFTTSTTGEHA